MPAILKIGPYRFLFHHNGACRATAHPRQGGREQSEVLVAPIQLAANYGFNGRQLNEILGLVEEHCNEFLEAWDEYFSR